MCTHSKVESYAHVLVCGMNYGYKKMGKVKEKINRETNLPERKD